jgi:hypothetical protein
VASARTITRTQRVDLAASARTTTTIIITTLLEVSHRFVFPALLYWTPSRQRRQRRRHSSEGERAIDDEQEVNVYFLQASAAPTRILVALATVATVATAYSATRTTILDLDSEVRYRSMRVCFRSIIELVAKLSGSNFASHPADDLTPHAQLSHLRSRY